MRKSNYSAFEYPYSLPAWVIETCKLAATHPRAKTPDRIVEVNRGKTTIDNDKDFDTFTKAVLACSKYREGYRSKQAYDNIGRLVIWVVNQRDKIDLASQLSPIFDQFFDRMATEDEMIAFVKRAWAGWVPIDDESAVKNFRSLGSKARDWPSWPAKRFITADTAEEWFDDRWGKTWPINDGKDDPDWEYEWRAAADGTGVWRIPVFYRPLGEKESA